MSSPPRSRSAPSTRCAALIDLIDLEAFVYEGAGRGNATRVEIPEDLRPQAEEYREKLMDEVAENSDELMERYLDGEEIDHGGDRRRPQAGGDGGADLPGHLRSRDPQPRHQPPARGAGRGPALAGDARPGGGARRRRRDARDRARRGRRRCVAYVFKTLADPYAGRINLLARLPRHAALRLPGRQRDPAREGADRPARPAAGQRADSGDASWGRGRSARWRS